MANIKSAKKRIKVIETKTAANKSRKSEIKTYIRKFEDAVKNEKFEDAKELLKLVEKKLDKAASKGSLHKKTAARRVSRLAKKIK
ncbi:MAG: 30S ribosomal protein S20 [Firmicutes bacterium]|nr:30S ribosomal protein S20 [Bacillota bacterium]